MPSIDINDLPPEILEDIFLLSTQSVSDGRNPYQAPARTISNLSSWSNPSVNPIILGRVCWYWRRVALSLHTLWANISILSPSNKDVSSLRLWLERSGTQIPLRLWIVEEKDYWDILPAPTVVQDILSQVLQVRHRWELLHLEVILAPQIQEYLDGNISNGVANALKTVSWCWDKSKSPDGAFLTRLWKHLISPSLQHIRCERFPALWSSINLQQLVELDIQELEVDTLITLLPSFFNLKVIKVRDLLEAGNGWAFPDNQIRLGSLKYLLIHKIRIVMVDLPRLLDLLITPMLEGVSIKFGCSSTELVEIALSIENLIIRSDATKQLRHIILNKSSMSRGLLSVEDDILTRLFKSPALSSVRTISTNYYARDGAISTLVLAPNFQFIPDLTYLTAMHCCISDDIITGFMNSRVPKIRHTRFYQSKRLFKHTNLQSLELPGMRTVVSEFCGSFLARFHSIDHWVWPTEPRMN
ncbi:hypothetical protein FA15DRAFT_692618 [Coprinopsis marcescibilis]|uniref:Uncharacterized protein n=1 Tax=Coprinopsis marcescibilis TaxID=230819 RepID=A0A5C3L3Y7_COPMA|nr:hypothetical protein FA15DRAFT_692618 [Coprinopsis marcescibilis]